MIRVIREFHEKTFAIERIVEAYFENFISHADPVGCEDQVWKRFDVSESNVCMVPFSRHGCDTYDGLYLLPTAHVCSWVCIGEFDSSCPLSLRTASTVCGSDVKIKCTFTSHDFHAP